MKRMPPKMRKEVRVRVRARVRRVRLRTMNRMPPKMRKEANSHVPLDCRMYSHSHLTVSQPASQPVATATLPTELACKG